MKTSLKSIALAFILATSFIAQAFAHEDKEANKNAHFGTGIYASRDGDIHIGIDKYFKDRTVVMVSDQSGKVIYKEVLAKGVTKFRKTLKVADLPIGTYTIEIACCNGGSKIVKTFDVDEKKVERTITLK